MLRLRSDDWGRTLRSVVWVAALGGLLLVSGCDTNGSERESNYQRLVGTWSPEQLLVNGADLTAQLDQRYQAVRIEFRSTEDGGRRYLLEGVRSSDSLRTQGGVALPRSNLLTMQAGFGRPVTWTFTFGELSSSVEFRLPATPTAGSGAFLETLLPGRGWGDSQRVQLDLLREQPPDEGANANFSQDG